MTETARQLAERIVETAARVQAERRKSLAEWQERRQREKFDWGFDHDLPAGTAYADKGGYGVPAAGIHWVDDLTPYTRYLPVLYWAYHPYSPVQHMADDIERLAGMTVENIEARINTILADDAAERAYEMLCK